MAHLLTAITQAEALEGLHEMLHKNKAQLKQLSSADFDLLMSQLTPQQNTLGMIYVLNSQATTLNPTAAHSWLQSACAVLSHANPAQAGMAMNSFLELCGHVARVGEQHSASVLCVRPLRAAVTLVQSRSTPNTLTAAHVAFLEAAVAAKAYKEATKLLDTPILEISPANFTLKPRGYMTFFYLAGVVYTALKRFADAVDAFQTCIATPAGSVSAIAVAAAKKLWLVSLIHNGTAAKLRSTTPTLVSTHLPDLLGLAYTGLATLFVGMQTNAVAACLKSNTAKYQQDNNLGLAKQVAASLRKHKVKQLTTTYMTLSLSDMASAAELEDAKEAEALLAEMIEHGDIKATIDKSSNMVSFTSELVDADAEAARTAAALSKHIASLSDLGQRIKRMDDAVSSSKEFLRKASKARSQPVVGAGAGAGATREYDGWDTAMPDMIAAMG